MVKLANTITGSSERQYIKFVPDELGSKNDLLINAVATLVIFGAIVTIALAASGHLHSFPQDFIRAFSHIGTAKGIIVTSSVIGGLIGGGIVIRNSVKNPDNGLFKGQSHWHPAYLVPTLVGHKEDRRRECDYDESTKTFYNRKDCISAKLIPVAVIVTAPLHAAATVVNNVLRLFIMPLKLAWNHKAHEIGAELKADLWRIVRTPFYAVAVSLAAIYTCFDQRNGAKLVGAIENQWNDKVPLRESSWAAPFYENSCTLLTCNPAPLVKTTTDAFKKWKQGGGMYVAGCMQPIATSMCNNQDEITEVSGYPCFYIPYNICIDFYTPYFKE